MKELVNIAANFGCALTEGGALAPQVEVIFIVTEPCYRLDATGALQRERLLEEVRLSMPPSQLRSTAKAMLKTAEDAELQIAKAMNDYAAKWTARQEEKP